MINLHVSCPFYSNKAVDQIIKYIEPTYRDYFISYFYPVDKGNKAYIGYWHYVPDAIEIHRSMVIEFNKEL